MTEAKAIVPAHNDGLIFIDAQNLAEGDVPSAPCRSSITIIIADVTISVPSGTARSDIENTVAAVRRQ